MGGKCCSQACVLVLQRLQEQSLGIALQYRKISTAGTATTWASLFTPEICIQTDVILCNIKEKSQKCSKGMLPLETACENTGKNQDLGIFFSSFLLLVAVNGSPATITIETCEDASDWSTSIGGMAWESRRVCWVEDMWGKREAAEKGAGRTLLPELPCMNLHCDYSFAAYGIALCNIPPVCRLAVQPWDEVVSKHQHIKARAKCGSGEKKSERS